MAVTPESFVRDVDMPNMKYCFEIVTSRGSLCLAAETHEEKCTWVRRLCGVKERVEVDKSDLVFRSAQFRASFTAHVQRLPVRFLLRDLKQWQRIVKLEASQRQKWDSWKSNL